MLTSLTNLIHVRHFLYLLPFILFVCLVIYTARIFKFYFTQKSIGFSVILVLGIFINWFFLNDYLEVNPIITWAILLFTIIALSFYTYKKFNIKLSGQTFFQTNNKDYLKLFLTYLIGIVLICVPLLFFLPKNVIVVGDGVSSDIIQHSVFAEGYSYTRSLNIIKDDDSYPRAFHSTMYYINQVVHLDPPYVILLGLIMFYGFMVFVVDDILFLTEFKNRKIKYLLMLLPIVPFLMLATLYNTFAPHIASLPFIILGLFAILNLDFKKKAIIQDILLIAILAFATFNIYSIFAVNVLVVGTAVKLIWEAYKRRLTLKSDLRFKTLKNNIVTNFPRGKYLLVTLVVLALAVIPAVPLLYTTWIYTRANTTFLLTSNGNLSNYLSPWHITGLWPSNLEYRMQPGVLASYILILIFAAELFFLFKAKMSSVLKLTLLVLFLLQLNGILLINNRYVEFKYITFLIPVFILVVGYGYVNFIDQIKNRNLNKFLSYGGLILFLAVTIIIPSMGYKQVPTINSDGKFNTLLALQQNYFDKASVLYIGFDDWTIYYRNQNDDYFPTLGYLHNDYSGQNIRYFIIDPIYVEDINKRVEDFLKKYPDLQAKINSTPLNCITTYLNRYTIYDLECQ